MNHHRAPAWLPGGQLQTVWPALFAHCGPAPTYRRETWDTPDGDFVDVDWQDADGSITEPPLLVLFHGLEGCSTSHYAVALAAAAGQRGWRFAVPHFRGCSRDAAGAQRLNRAPRAYHSGDFAEVGWMLGRLRAAHRGPLYALGVSLGGNALLRWAEEAGDSATATARAVAAVSAPVDLAASGAAIGQGLSWLIYTRALFLPSLKRKALAMLQRHPRLFDRERLISARDLYDFDDLVTGPLHGFAGADDYWHRASAKPHLHRLRLPALLLNARNDPFTPPGSLPGPREVGPTTALWQPAHGGHVGFGSGRWPGHLRAMPDAVLDWLAARV